MKRFVALVAAVSIPALAVAETTTWNLDPKHSDTTFAVRHLVISTVRGHFGTTTGTIRLDDKDLAQSSVEATVDVTTIDTRVPDRDAHLKSPDFFDAAKYPTMTFRSTQVRKAGPDRLKVTGDLTIKGTTKPVTFDVTYSPKAVHGPSGEERRGFTATTKINRKDFGLNWAKTVDAGPVVGNEVKIEVDAEAVQQAPKREASAPQPANPKT